MYHVNKAHAATVNRLLRRYGSFDAEANIQAEGQVDVPTLFGRIDVETEVTIGRAVRRLKQLDGPCYIAVTNREAIPTALKAIRGTSIGLMDPQGDVITPAATEGARRRKIVKKAVKSVLCA